MSTMQPNIVPVKLGGVQIAVFRIGLGLLFLTGAGQTTPDEQAFNAIKTAIDLVPSDQKLFINSAEFYGTPTNPLASLQLLQRFFTKYPELADRTFLSVKGGTKIPYPIPDCSPENVRRSVDACLDALGGTKKIDLFECARIDKAVPIEDMMATLEALRSEGKFDHIGLSEVAAETVKRANAIHPIAAVEIEVSPLSLEEETIRVISVTKELGIPIIAYSPLGRGLISNDFRKENLGAGDFRLTLARFQDDAMEHNQKIIETLDRIAKRRGVTVAQASIAWVCAQGPHVIPLPGSSKPSRIKENMEAGRIELEEEELKELAKVLEAHGVKGGRYFNPGGPDLSLWG